MAEILEKQGLLGDALKIYRRLAQNEPDNTEWPAKVEELETRLPAEKSPPAGVSIEEQHHENTGRLRTWLDHRRDES